MVCLKGFTDFTNHYSDITSNMGKEIVLTEHSLAEKYEGFLHFSA